MKLNKNQIGEMGENYIMYKLSQLGISACRVPTTFDYDFITHNNLKIEVKTANITYGKKTRRNSKGIHKYKWEHWTFANIYTKLKHSQGNIKAIRSKRDRICDFFIFNCIQKNNQIISYIIPKKLIKDNPLIVISDSNKCKWNKFKEGWDILC